MAGAAAMDFPSKWIKLSFLMPNLRRETVGMKKTRDKELWLHTILQLLPNPTQIDPHLVGCCEHKHIRLSRKGLCIHMRAFFSPSILYGSQHIIYLLDAMNEAGSKRRYFIMLFSSI